MSNSTSISYEFQDTFIHRLNPVTKLVAVIWMIIVSFIISAPYLVLTCCLLLIIFSLLAKSFKKVFKLAAMLILPVALFLGVVHGFLNPENTTILQTFSLLGFELQLGKEGLMVAYRLVSKLILLLPSVFLFVSTTSQERLMPNLIKKGVSSSASYLFLATLNVIPHMKSRLETIKMAQEARGIVTSGSFFIRIKAFIPVIMPLILSSLMDVKSRSVTLEVRSFGVKKKTTSLYDLTESKLDKVIQRLLTVLLLLLIVLKVYLGSRI